MLNSHNLLKNSKILAILSFQTLSTKMIAHEDQFWVVAVSARTVQTR